MYYGPGPEPYENDKSDWEFLAHYNPVAGLNRIYDLRTAERGFNFDADPTWADYPSYSEALALATRADLLLALERAGELGTHPIPRRTLDGCR